MPLNRYRMLFRTRLGSFSQSTYIAQTSKRICRLLRVSSSVSTTGSGLDVAEIGTGTINTESSRNLNGKAVPPRLGLDFEKDPYVHVQDKDTARAIAERVKEAFNRDDVILEFNAGPGLLSTALLKRNMKKLVSLEAREQFHHKLQKIKDKNQDSFNFFPLSMSRVLLCSNEQLLVELQGTVDLKECRTVQIIAQVYSWELLINIARQVRDMQSFLMDKSVKLFMIVPEFTWNKFTDTKVAKRCIVERILFMISFDYKISKKFDGSKFYFSPRRRKNRMESNKEVVLLEAESRKTGEFDYTEMQIFLSQFHNHVSRNRYVIPSLEQWSPSCGENLIKGGMPVYTKFSDLKPRELLELLNFFKGLPNVEASDFFVEEKERVEEIY